MIERKPDSQKYRIVDKGITVEFLSRLLGDLDWPVSRICENYGLTPAEVHAAWAFYYDHKDEIDRRIQEATDSYDASDNQARRDKLIQRYEQRTGRKFK